MSQKLVRTFNKLKTRETKVDYDVIICVGEDQNSKEYYSNSKSLRNKSEYFKKKLSDKNIEKKGGKYIIKESNVTPQVFDVIIKYLSEEKFNVANKSENEILSIIIASYDLQLNKLVKIVEDSFFEHQQFLHNDPVEILQAIFSHKCLVDLQEYCLETICFEPKVLFDSDKFNNLPAPLLEIILERDDLRFVEIEIWDYLIKWGLAQEKTLDEDVSKWDQENFNIFESVLRTFIPLIRFYDISSEDYYNKVRPYEEIMPKDLHEEILRYHMVPGYTPTFDTLLPRRSAVSNLINRKHILLLTNWINKRKRKANYNFNLIFRASRDGNTAAAFHAKCDDKGATIVVVKVANSKQIIGGYNPLEWNSSGTWKPTNDSFIFSISNKNGLQDARVAYSKGEQYSIGCFSYCGPVFGISDLYIRYDDDDNIWKSEISSYPTLNLSNNIKVDDYEVFQVVKTCEKGILEPFLRTLIKDD